MKIYDLVKNILENSEQTRNSDKLLIWEVYKKIGIVKDVEWFGDREAIIRDNFLSARIPATETITRARRKIQELHPAREHLFLEKHSAKNPITNPHFLFLFFTNF